MTGSPGPDEPAPRRRRPLRTGAAAVALLVLALGVAVGVPVPAGPLRGLVERHASEALGRPVQVESLALRVGWRCRAALEGLRVGDPAGDDEGHDRLQVDELAVEIDAPALLRRRLHVREARIRGVALRLARAPPAQPAATDLARRAAPGSREPPSSPWSLDVDRLSADDVQVLRALPGGPEPIRTSLDRLRGRIRWDHGMVLSLEGRHEEIPFSARLEGDAPAVLRSGADAWPLQLQAALAGGELDLEARVATAPGVVRIEDLVGQLGPTPFEGELAFETRTGRPHLRGRLALGDVPLHLPAPAAEGSAAPPKPRAHRDPERQSSGASPGPLVAAARLLHGFDVDAELTVARLVAPGPAVEDVRVAVQIEEGSLELPVAVRVAAIPLEGTLRLEDPPSGPRLGLSLEARASSVDALFEALAPDAHVRGGFETLAVELEGGLGGFDVYLATLHARLRAAEARLTYGAEDPKPLLLDLLELSVDEGQPLRVEARGALLDVPVEAAVEAGSLISLLEEAAWPLHVSVRGAGAHLALEGARRRDASGPHVEAELRLRGEQLAELEPWVGRLPVADGPYALRATWERAPGRMRLRLDEARLGPSRLRGEIGHHARDEGGILSIALEADRLDLTELSPGPEAGEERSGAATAASADAATLDVPILPGGLRLGDADVDLDVGSLRVGDLELADLRFDGAIRDGHLPEASLGLALGDVRLDGTLSLDLRETPHEAGFTLGAREVDVGRLLESLGLAEGLDLRAGRLALAMQAQGATGSELLRDAELDTRVEDARWTLRDGLSGAELATLALDTAEVTRRPDEPDLRLRAEGTLRDQPVTLEAHMPEISLVQRSSERVPLTLELRTDDARLAVETAATLPLERQELEVDLHLAGQRLDRASFLLGRELPAIGPYEARTRLRLTPRDYRLTQLGLRVGSSELHGSGRLDTRGERPTLELELASDRIQLDDFLRPASAGPATQPLPSEADRAPRPGGAAKGTREEAAEPAGEASRRASLDELLAPERLRSLDGRVVVRVDRVLSGEDVLGRGELGVVLDGGRLRVEPLALELPGGSVDLRAELAAAGEGVEGRLAVRSRRFDYGILARRIDPETDMAGWISLDMDVAGRAARPSELLAGSSGHLDFFAAPESIATDVFDLWAVNVLRVLLPRVDDTPRSSLNCVVARFGLEDGVMRERSLYLDTTGMVVRGRSTVDFREGTLHAVLTPTPKKAQFLSLQTRVKVSGEFEDFSVGVPPGELVGTVVRFVTSVVTTPLRRVLQGPLPADGEATCREAWRRGEVAPAQASVD